MNTTDVHSRSWLPGLAGLLFCLLAASALSACRSLPERTAARQIRRAVVLQNLVVSQRLYERGRLCLLTWYGLQCRRLADLKLVVKETTGIYIYNTDAYQPSQNANPFRQDGAGITLNYQAADAVSLSGRAAFELVGSGLKSDAGFELHGVLFLSKSTPPFLREMAEMPPASRHQLSAFYMKKLFGTSEQARITWPDHDGELAGLVHRRPDPPFFWSLSVKSWADEVLVVDEETVNYQ